MSVDFEFYEDGLTGHRVLTLLQISTIHNDYLVDIFKPEMRELFKEILRPFFEDPKVIKIFYDC